MVVELRIDVCGDVRRFRDGGAPHRGTVPYDGTLEQRI